MGVFLGFGYDLPGNFVADCKLGDLASLAFDSDSLEFLVPVLALLSDLWLAFPAFPGNFVGCGFDFVHQSGDLASLAFPVFRDFDNVGDRRGRALWNVFYRAGTAPRAAHSHL